MVDRIMIVDDERTMAHAIARTLERKGYQCRTFFDGHEALAGFDREGADLVITDQRMPTMNGVTLLRHLRERRPELPVIILTAYGDVSRAVEAMKEGAFDYLTKPFDNNELRTLVGRALKLNRLERENDRLRKALTGDDREVLAESPAMKQVLALVDRAADSDATVLILGESGTGKEVIARRLHLRSTRLDRPMVAVNCKAFAESLLESELFGHVKGAFTGAQTARTGCFERAHDGTLFLDEIGEISLSFQAKLLRVLQEREVVPVGGDRARKVDVRLIAATNRDLRAEMAADRFREDLYFRLNVIPIQLPPLRDRSEDILPLAERFLDAHAQRTGRAHHLSQSACDRLMAHPWPGNVRELENAVERAAVLAREERIEAEDLLLERLVEPGPKKGEVEIPSLQEALDRAAERCITDALKAADGRKRDAARLLGVDRTTLYRFMKRLDLS
ncbi:Sigma-54-dependent Fis family transcriptional regulator [Sulfidibacter corallicola]|uniref:Sigma-54-dependent Fis family transcriptional regulator n=1 Tax=Sulfidibacter corallicola TaxID=2818388 RepID=A0A8A4TQ51_SULCO|nr:sigma-54 dependent transcriptional regulator [Sulfidibacter corallicola]QTD51314.1 sigma-54-dependent Fis family transcriptional regulator [Sulfidibacter corallicola]